MKRLILSVIVVGVLLLPACSTPTTTSTTSTPTTTSTPATTSEAPIPSDYKTYISEGLFSISYPFDWEPSLTITEMFELLAKEELITIIESDLPIVEGSPVLEFPSVFFADVPTEEGDNPYVAIVVGDPPSTGRLDNVVEEMISGAKGNPAAEYNEFSRVKTTVGGREAVIIDYQSVNLYTGATVRWLSMYTLVGKTVWVIACLASSEMFSDYEEDFHAIVNSFRMLNW